MNKFFVLISLVFLSPISVYSQIRIGIEEMALEQTIYYNAQISFSGEGGVSGICVIKANQNGLAGSLVNEFGIKALDFTYDAVSHKVKLHSIIKFLDKWYIRRILRKDLSLLLRDYREPLPSKHYVKLCHQDGRVSLEDSRHKIHYLLIPFNKDEVTQ